MTEVQIWVVLGVMSAVALAFFVVALVDFILVMREKPRPPFEETRSPSAD